MSSSPTLHSRIRGCLTGAAIGSELSFARNVHPGRVARSPQDFAGLIAQLAPAERQPMDPHWTLDARLDVLVDLGVRTYVQRDGRATPEDFAQLFKQDAGLSAPALFFDNLHTIQEVLQEGMHPRISGLGNAPHGLLCAAMPATGIYHLADPERAYLDGVELASVAQGRAGANWAGLCAAAIAAAFEPGASGRSVTDRVLRIAAENDKELFGQLNLPVLTGRRLGSDAFAEWWLQDGGYVPTLPQVNFTAWNPPRYFLPLLTAYADQPEWLMAFLTGAPAGNWYYSQNGLHGAAAIVAGAVAGALHGVKIFPAAWREWSERIAQPWLKIEPVVQARLNTEREIISVLTSLDRERTAGGVTQLQDKLRGCLLAGAIGNAMGSPVENLHYRDIDAKHPGGIRTILEPQRLEAEDDNQMAALLTETYIERDGQPVMARHFGKTWKERLNRDFFFVQCMGHVCDLIRADWDPRITGHWAQVTGSAVICMEPVGLYNLLDPEFAAIDATAVSYMYQRGLDVSAAAMLGVAVAEAFRPNATVDSVITAALAICPTSSLRTFDRRPFSSARDYLNVCLDIASRHDDVLAVREELYARCLFHHPIEPLEVWGLSLAMFKVAKGDVRQSAIGGTNIGRDSDTIAGRAALLSGILGGSAGVPPEWIALFSQTSLDRIDDNALRFARLLTAKKLPRLQGRQTVAAARA